MVVVVDIDLEDGYMVIVIVVREVESIMEVIVDMAVLVGGMVKLAVVVEKVGVTSVSMLVIFKEM